MTIVLAADDHEHDSVAPCWPCCKVTVETLPVALSTRACRFLLLHFGNVPMQNPRVFEAFQTKTSQLTLKIMVFATLPQNLTRKQDKELYKK